MTYVKDIAAWEIVTEDNLIDFQALRQGHSFAIKQDIYKCLMDF